MALWAILAYLLVYRGRLEELGVRVVLDLDELLVLLVVIDCYTLVDVRKLKKDVLKEHVGAFCQEWFGVEFKVGDFGRIVCALS
ncbi:hypothetical protein [Helicobacter heilmannii]|uniref:Uncharacterized protein n=1 Tax=Helicobacter heilmannii TaxID=35817 RepID=A0A0K2Y863_HELHE|nr:hypothetical protein [Helicobacter heilmannii]CCM12047.1 hypothetical protein BN341_6020 [Helicobacter heilmannii ASB1.4]CCM73423.1 hypothetical protein BN341_6060 [Helicobacter heilmannii ASB1.4]CCM73513.1 hypothetical protein BN341_9300 [Helicobacter heilmannii ASB1.4]CRI34322.1 hypothetical protein HHE01_11680 [Helicobacter heilmannii]BDQ27105.1 hypothetical protein ASB1_07810 [Helicobacter heilmannii]